MYLNSTMFIKFKQNNPSYSDTLSCSQKSCQCKNKNTVSLCSIVPDVNSYSKHTWYRGTEDVNRLVFDPL